MEKKKSPMSLIGLIVLIIFLAAVVGGLVYFFINYDLQIMSKDKENEVSQVENKEEIEESKIEELDKDSELVKELYNIVLKYDDSFGSYAWQNGDTASFYKDKKITLSSLSNIERMLVIRKNNENMSEISNENDKNKILKDVNFETDLNTGNIYVYPNINKITNKIFNKDVEELNLIKCRGCALDIIYKDDFIYDIEFEGGGMGNAEYAYSEIQKVEQNKEQIYIYDKYIYLDFLKAWLPEDDELVHIYTSADKTKEIGKEEDKFVFWDDVNKKEYSDKEIFGSVYQKYKDKLNTYKHTFQKSENGTYYWVSSEIYEVAEDKESITLKLGEYTVEEVKYDEAGVSNFDCGITLKENNEFKIYMGWGSWYSGKYEIKENNLICKANLNEWDGGAGAGNRATNVTFTYKILDDNKIKLINIEDNDTEYQNNFYEEALSIGMTYSIK